ncbi:MAG: TetR/AcrR family transcriptional regulator [Candidatus Binatia bacterium]
MSRTGGEERRRLLLAEAIRSFGVRGYRSTSLDGVADEIGVRKQTLLYYFPSKRKLFRACVDEFTASIGSTLERALESRQKGWGRIEAVIRTVFELAEKRPELLFFAQEAARQTPGVVQRVAAALEPLRKRAIHFLERGMEEGEFRRQDPAVVLFTLYTAVVGSLTEAAVWRVLAGAGARRMTLRTRQEELIGFVHRALARDRRARGSSGSQGVGKRAGRVFKR